MDTGDNRKRIGQKCNIQFYQTLNSTKRIKVHQGGTRCLKGDTLINTIDGYIPISEIEIGQMVYCKSDDDKIVERKIINKFIYTGEHIGNKCITFVLINNQKITCTYDHKWFTKNGYVKAIDIAKRIVERNSANKRPLSGKQFRPNCHNELQKFTSGSNYEAGKRCKRILSNYDYNQWKIKYNKSAQNSGTGIYSKSIEQIRSQSHKQQQGRQSHFKFGMGYKKGKFGSYVKSESTIIKQRIEKWNGQINRKSGFSNPSRIQAICSSETRISKKIQRVNFTNKRYCGESNVEAFALNSNLIKDVIFENIHENVYDIEVDEFHNFLATTDNIISHNSGKTYALCQYLIYKLTSSKKPLVISIVRKTLPALKGSVQRDFLEILDNLGILYVGQHNKSENTYTFGNHVVEFLSVDEPQKIRGRKRNICYCNEVNELDHEDFRQLLMRTTDEMICDFNPSDPVHWIYDEVITRDDCDTWITTYLDNKFLPAELVNEIERLKAKDPDYWRVYGEGKRAVFSDRQIFPNWQFIPKAEFPEFDDVFYGLDFGFSHDPTAIVQLAKVGDKLYIHEIMYKKGMTNRDIADFLKEKKINEHIIYCESAEPKSIEELRQMDILAVPAIKGEGSIKAGISLLKEHEVICSKESSNLHNEFQFYFWEQLKDGTIINKPIDKHNHLMDAIRYGVYTKYKNRSDFFVV